MAFPTLEGITVKVVEPGDDSAPPSGHIGINDTEGVMYVLAQDWPEVRSRIEASFQKSDARHR